MGWRSGQSYSQDLRDRVLGAVDGGMAVRAAAARFGVSIAYIYKALMRRRLTGDAGINQYVRDVLDVANLVLALPDLQQRIIFGGTRIGRVEQQDMAEPRAPAGGELPVLALDVVDDGRSLFAASRVRRSSANDADRLRKYLARFGLEWSRVVDG